MIFLKQKIKLKIIDMSHMAYGVAKYKGITIFVEGALLDEFVIAIIKYKKKNYAIAEIVEITEASPHRVIDFDDTLYLGTMPLKHMSYPLQLKFKEKQFSKMMNRFNCDIDPILGMQEPYRYRNKAQIPVRTYEGRLETGVFLQKTHDLMPVKDFLIQDPRIDEVIILVRDLLREFGYEAYDENLHRGDIRHIVIRKGYYTDQIMVILVTLDHVVIHSKFIDILNKKIPDMVSLIQNYNSSRTNLIFGEKDRVLWGQPYYEDVLMDKKFKISSQAFFQVNSIQTENLYRKVIDYANFQGNEIVLDAYAGIASIGIIVSDYVKHVYSVEIVKEAAFMGRLNTKINDVRNVEVIDSSIEDMMNSFFQKESIDVLIVDPPRKGLDPSFIDLVSKQQVPKIIYISCNPKTLTRDLVSLSQVYRVVKTIPVDMFPHTLHLESVTLLKKRSIN